MGAGASSAPKAPSQPHKKLQKPIPTAHAFRTAAHAAAEALAPAIAGSASLTSLNLSGNISYSNRALDLFLMSFGGAWRSSA